MRSVLLVSNVTLDESGGRSEKFASRKRLLREYGWKMEVLHVPEPRRIGPFPSPTSVLQGIQIVRKNNIDVINSVNGPQQLHAIGYLISRFTDRPWLTEFRDPLAEKPFIPDESWRKRARMWIERFIVEHADQIVWNDGIQLSDNYFSNIYPEISPECYHKLPSHGGFEGETFERIEATEYDEWTLTYSGSFYDGAIEPYSFIKGLHEYAQTHETSHMRVQFYGDWDHKYSRAAERADVADLIETHDWVTYDEMVAVLKGSDALLHIGGNDFNNRKGIPSKISDYIGARRPIIGVLDPSFRAAEVIEDNSLGIVGTHGDPASIANAIDSIRSGQFKYQPSEAIFEKYSRQYWAEAFQRILSRC